ncbi:MAG TPA: penicillin-binding protein 2 [Armatimonadota bacterium]|jgi:cell division protein FtsI/penicillin-binding protein 2
MARKSFSLGQRGRILFALLALGYSIIGVRLAWIQVVRRGAYQALADRYHLRTIVIPAKRGVIKDRNGELLAINADAGSVSIDPSFYWNPAKWPVERLQPVEGGKKGRRRVETRVQPDRDAAAKTIADTLQMDFAEVRPKLDKRTEFVYLKRHVSLDNIRRADAAQILGLRIDDEPKRMYPMGSLAAHILGFTNSEGVGQYGMELVCDRLLARKDGSEVQEVDRKGRIIPGTLRSEKDPLDGASVTLTIDARIQQVAERELGRACDQYKAIGGTCTVVDPNTGEILAMANYPRFDPNQPYKVTAKDENGRPRPDMVWKAHAVTDNYEPGSTMKGITASAAVNEHAVSLTERFNCPQQIRIGSHTIHDVTHGTGAFGMLDLAGILAHSSNVGMSQVGLRLGAARLDKYVHAFGLLDRTGIEVPGEGRSGLPPASSWARHFTATIAFGQSISFTPLRLVMAYGAIANGGTLLKPSIIKRIERPATANTPAQSEERKPQSVRRVITPETARTMTALLSNVVTDGTGKPAKIRGYQLVGKTGSAQKVVHGRYESGKFIASFIGFLPRDKPRAVILVTVDEPKGTHWGATAAAPVFREVARQTMWYLNVPPDDPSDRFDGSEPRTWPVTGRKRTARR